MIYNRKRIFKQAMAQRKVEFKRTPFFGKCKWALVDFDSLSEKSPLKSIRENINRMYISPGDDGVMYFRFVMENSYDRPRQIQKEATREMLEKELAVRNAFVESTSIRDLDENELKKSLRETILSLTNERINAYAKQNKTKVEEQERKAYLQNIETEFDGFVSRGINYLQLLDHYSSIMDEVAEAMDRFTTKDPSKAHKERFSFDVSNFNRYGLAKIPEGDDNTPKGFTFSPNNKEMLFSIYMRYTQKAEDHPEIENGGEIAMLNESVKRLNASDIYDPSSYINKKIKEHENSDGLSKMYKMCGALGLPILIPSWYQIGYHRYHNREDEVLVSLAKKRDGNKGLFQKVQDYLMSLPDEERENHPLAQMSDRKLKERLNLVLTYTLDSGEKIDSWEEVDGKWKRSNGSRRFSPTTPQGSLLRDIGPYPEGRSEGRVRNFTPDQVADLVEKYRESLSKKNIDHREADQILSGVNFSDNPEGFFADLEYIENALYSDEYNGMGNSIDPGTRAYAKYMLLLLKKHMFDEIRNNIHKYPAHDEHSYLYLYDELAKLYLDYHVETFGPATLLRSSAVNKDGYFSNPEGYMFAKDAYAVPEPFLPTGRSNSLYELTISVKYAYSTSLPTIAKTALPNNSASVFETHKEKILEELDREKDNIEFITTTGEIPQMIKLSDSLVEVQDFFDNLKGNPNNVLVFRAQGGKLKYFCGFSTTTKKYLGNPKIVPAFLDDGTRVEYRGNGSIRAPYGKSGTHKSLLGSQAEMFEDEEKEAREADSVGGSDTTAWADGATEVMDEWEDIINFAIETYGLDYDVSKLNPAKSFKKIPTTIFAELGPTKSKDLMSQIKKESGLIMSADSMEIINRIINSVQSAPEEGNVENQEPVPDASAPRAKNTSPVPSIQIEEETDSDPELDPELVQ